MHVVADGSVLCSILLDACCVMNSSSRNVCLVTEPRWTEVCGGCRWDREWLSSG